MKRFVDEKGTFEIYVPENWKYSLKSEKVHTFQYYLSVRNFDTFQITINDLVSVESIKEFRMKMKGKKYKIINEIKFYHTINPPNGNHQMIIFIGSLEKKMILITYMVDIENNNNPDLKQYLEEKLNLAFEIIQSFRLVKPEHSISVYESYLFSNFINGVAASKYLLYKAIEKKSFIEVICLIANLIDALLRIGIVLKYQLINKNSEIEKVWIYQGDNDKAITERMVFDKAIEIQVINESTYKQLDKQYRKRNKVVHRYIISELNLADIEEIAKDFYFLFEKINSIIIEIEEEQINTKTGMTFYSDKIDIDFLKLIKSKIVNFDLITNES